MSSGFQGNWNSAFFGLVGFSGLDQCCTDLYSFLWIGFGSVFLGKDLVFRTWTEFTGFVSMDWIRLGFLRIGFGGFSGLGLVFFGSFGFRRIWFFASRIPSSTIQRYYRTPGCTRAKQRFL